jgi:hypothetical protein
VQFLHHWKSAHLSSSDSISSSSSSSSVVGWSVCILCDKEFMSFDHLWQHIEDQHPLLWTNSSSSTEFAVLQIGSTTNLVDGWLAKKRCTPDDDDATVHATTECKDYHHHKKKKMVHDSDKGFKPEDCNNTRRKMEMLSEKVDNTTAANNSKLKWRLYQQKTLENSSSRKMVPPYNIMDDLLRVLLSMW